MDNSLTNDNKSNKIEIHFDGIFQDRLATILIQLIILKAI